MFKTKKIKTEIFQYMQLECPMWDIHNYSHLINIQNEPLVILITVQRAQRNKRLLFFLTDIAVYLSREFIGIHACMHGFTG